MVLLLCFSGISPVDAQEKRKDNVHTDLNDKAEQDRISVFLDCSSCDNTYIRQQLKFVDHVRDPKLAEVHLFVTAQRTGSGGRIFTLSFIGRDEFTDINNTLTYTSPPTNTPDEEREGLLSLIRLGLLSYVAHTPVAEAITVDIPLEFDSQLAEIEDPWNNWIFELYGGANFTRNPGKVPSISDMVFMPITSLQNGG